MPEDKDRGPDFFKQQQSLGEERLKIDREKMMRGGWVMEGGDLVDEINEAKIEDLPRAVYSSLAWKDGLFFGPKNYDLDLKEDKDVLLHLQDLFTSVEGSTQRPYSYYIDSALREKIGGRVREIKRNLDKEGRSSYRPEEKSEINELIKLQNHIESRTLIDFAFRQRQQTVYVAEFGAKLLGQAPDGSLSITPDKTHWEAAFQGDFGLKVDKVLRKIVEMGRGQNPREDFKKEGIDYNLYVEGFKTDKIFKIWLEELLKEADNRMDVVWFAWRLALVWEIPATIAMGKGKTKDLNGKSAEIVEIAKGPIGNDLYEWIAHFEEKRALEFGYSLDGRRVQISKNITHTGYPLSLGKICTPTIGEYYDVVDHPENVRQLVLDFLHYSKLGGEKTLWSEWWREGKRLGGDPDGKNINWSLTEILPDEGETDSVSPGSFSAWFLKRSRAWQVVEDFRSRPGFRGEENIRDSDFFVKKVRVWDKVLGKVNENTPPEKNPRTWWVAGIILHSHIQPNDKIPLARENADKVYRSYSSSEKWTTAIAGNVEAKKPIIAEILNHAFQCGFLRKLDIDWLYKNLNIPKSLVGDEVYRV